jgi:hypothetical protein
MKQLLGSNCNTKYTEHQTDFKVDFIPTLLRRLTPTLCACTEPAIVTHGTPMYKDSHVVVVPAYGNVSKLQKK